MIAVNTAKGDKMKNKYETPQIHFTVIDTGDIITVSVAEAENYIISVGFDEFE